MGGGEPLGGVSLDRSRLFCSSKQAIWDFLGVFSFEGVWCLCLLNVVFLHISFLVLTLSSLGILER